MASIETAVVSNGDLLLQMTDGSIQNVGRVQGPPGADGLPGLQGLKGDTGRPGRDGATFHTNFGPPSPGQYKDGDLYVDVQTSDLSLYQKIGGQWARIGGLKGQPGPPGASGAGVDSQDWGVIINPGSPPTSDNSGEPIEEGDIWFDTNTGLFYVYVPGNGWVPVQDHPPANVGPTPPDYTTGSDPSDPNKRFPVRVGDQWFDSEQLALYTAVEDANNDLVWIIATPSDRSAVLDEVPGSFVLPAAAQDKSTATNPITGVTYIYNAPKNQWIDFSIQCWREDLVYTDNLAGGGDFYKDGNAYIFNNAKTWPFSNYITKVGDVVYIDRGAYTVTSYASIPVDGFATGMALEFDRDLVVIDGETYTVSNCPDEPINGRNPDLLMQLRSYFEMDATDTYAILPDGIVEDYYDAQTGSELEYLRPGVWWIDPSFNTSNDARYRPSTLTHLLISPGRSIDYWDENTQEYVYVNADLAPLEFRPGDYINISARGIDIYQPEDDPDDRRSWGQRFNDVWRVVERYEVKDDNNVAPGWKLGGYVYAYKVEKAVRDHAVTNREWTLYETDDEVSRIPCAVDHWHDINDIQREVFGGEERYDPALQGRSRAQVANWDGDNGELFDATVQNTFFNATQNYVAFNKDLIPSGNTSWQSRLSPYPQHIFLKFDNGEKINFVVEFIARAGLNNRSYNFRILDRGNLPLGDLSSIDGVEFEVYKYYEAPRDGLQTQIDGLNNSIIELEEEVEALAPSVERGVWGFKQNGIVGTRGEIALYDDDYAATGTATSVFASAKAIWINQEDTTGTLHGFLNVDAGKLIQLFVEGQDDFGLYEVVDVHDETQGASSWWVIDVNFVRDFDGTSDAANGDNIRVKIFSAPTGADASTLLSKYGDDVQDATGAADYKWNTAVSFQSDAGVELKSDAITAKDAADNTFIPTADAQLTPKNTLTIDSTSPFIRS